MVTHHVGSLQPSRPTACRACPASGDEDGARTATPLLRRMTPGAKVTLSVSLPATWGHDYGISAASWGNWSGPTGLIHFCNRAQHKKTPVAADQTTSDYRYPAKCILCQSDKRLEWLTTNCGLAETLKQFQNCLDSHWSQTNSLHHASWRWADTRPGSSTGTDPKGRLASLNSVHHK